MAVWQLHVLMTKKYFWPRWARCPTRKYSCRYEDENLELGRSLYHYHYHYDYHDHDHDLDLDLDARHEYDYLPT